GPNGLGCIAAYFGTVCTGAVAVPLDDQASKDMLVAVLSHSRAGFAFTSARRVAELCDTAAALQHYALLDGDTADPLHWTMLPTAATAPRVAVDPEQTASLLFTSGTTGTPKAVPLSHR